uniref:Uncharacterized protein n=1 Tax=Globodera rostochiensis TaxID=31243 RepID=A0A914GWP6_GLORO
MAETGESTGKIQVMDALDLGFSKNQYLAKGNRGSLCLDPDLENVLEHDFSQEKSRVAEVPLDLDSGDHGTHTDRQREIIVKIATLSNLPKRVRQNDNSSNSV